MRMYGGTRQATSAYTVGHKVRDSFITSFTATGVAGAGASVPTIWVIDTQYSVPGSIVADIGDVIEISDSNVKVEVIGVLNGGTLNKYGVDVSRNPLTSGTSLGATPTSHILIVEALQNEIVPAVTSSSILTVSYNTREDGACPNNYYKSKMPYDMRFGFSQIRTDYKESANMSATQLDMAYGVAGNKTGAFLSTIGIADLHCYHLYKVENNIIWGERKTNINDLERDKKQNNGLFTQVLANGGIVMPYAGTWTFADTKALLLKLRDAGVDEAILYAGNELYQTVMDTITNSAMFINNYQVNITQLGTDFCFKTSVGCIDYGGVKLQLKPAPMFSDANGTGAKHTYDGFVVPVRTSTVTACNGESLNSNAVNIWFKKDMDNTIFDENYSWYTGGASQKHDSACDVKQVIHKTEVCTELIGVEQFAAIIKI